MSSQFLYFLLMFGMEIANNPKQKLTIENITRTLQMLCKSISQDKLIPFDQKKMAPQLKQYACACNNIISAINSKFNQLQKTKKFECDEKNIIQLLRLGSDLSSNWNKKIDDKLSDLNIKNNKNEAKDLLTQIRSHMQLQSSLHKYLKTDHIDRIAPAIQAYINKVSDYQRDIAKISKLIQPNNGFQHLQRLKLIESYINQQINQEKQRQKEIEGYINQEINQEKIFTTIINNLSNEAYDVVINTSQNFGEKQRKDIAKLVQNQQFNRKKSGQILVQLRNILKNSSQQPLSTRVNLTKIGQYLEKIGVFFKKLSENKLFEERFNEIHNSNKLMTNILQTYIQTLKRIERSNEKKQKQFDVIKGDSRVKVQQSNLLSFAKQCYKQLRVENNPKTLNIAINKTQQMLNRIRSLVILEDQYQILNKTFQDNEKRLKELQNTNKEKQSIKAKIQHYEKFNKGLEQDYRKKQVQLAILEDKVRETAGYKMVSTEYNLQKPINPLLSIQQVSVYLCFQEINKKLKKLAQMQESNFMKQNQVGINNKVLMQQNKQLFSQNQQLKKQLTNLNGQKSINNSLQLQLKRKQQQATRCKDQFQKQKDRLLKLMQQKDKRIAEIETENSSFFSRIKKQQNWRGQIEAAEQQKYKQKQISQKNSIQQLKNKINVLQKNISKKQEILKQKASKIVKNNQKIERKILSLIDYQFQSTDEVIQQHNYTINQQENTIKALKNLQFEDSDDQLQKNFYLDLLPTLKRRIQQQTQKRAMIDKKLQQANIQIQKRQRQIISLKELNTKLIQQNKETDKNQKNGQLERQISELKIKMEDRTKVQNLLKEKENIIIELLKEKKLKEQQITQLQKDKQQLSKIKYRLDQQLKLALQQNIIKLNNSVQKQQNNGRKIKLISKLKQLKEEIVKLKKQISIIKAEQQQVKLKASLFKQLIINFEKGYFSNLSAITEIYANSMQKIKQQNQKNMDNLEKKYKQKFQKNKKDLQQEFQLQKNNIKLLYQGAEIRQQLQEYKGPTVKELSEKIQQLQIKLAQSNANVSADKDYKIQFNNQKDMLQKQLKKQKQLRQKHEDQIKQKMNQIKLKQDQLDHITREYQDLKKNTSKIVDQLSSLEKQKNELASKTKELLKSQELDSRIEFLSKYHNFIHGKIQPNLSFILQLSKLFQGKMMENELQHKFTILSHLNKIKAEPLLKTQLLFKYDTINDKSFHKYIDNHSNLLCIAKTAKGIFLAAYYSGLYASIPNRPMAEPGLLMNLNNNQSYVLKTPQPKQTILMKSMVYDDYYLIFGNAEFRIRSQENTIFSNFAVMGGYFNNRGHKIDKFLCEGNERQTLMQSYEIYELFFEQEKRERNE